MGDSRRSAWRSHSWVTLSLVFSAAQVYRVSSASADIQDVSDACVLAAEGEVAEFMIAVRVCDAMVLSLSLTSAAMFGLGVVALCAPPAAELGIELVNLGTKVLQARNTFAERAASGLNALQEALPFLAAASAYAAASSNSGGVMAASYLGIAMLVPAEGERIEVGASKALSDAADAVSEDAESIKQASEEAEEAAKEAFSAKEEGFKRDCGDAPAYCMYERAEALSSISSPSNPLFHTVDAWSFSVALDRAKAYYSARFEDEAPQSSAIEEQAESALRKVFYRFALAEVSRGFVLDTGDSFDAFFPLLPKNTAEMKATGLYTGSGVPAWEGLIGRDDAPCVGRLPEYVSQHGHSFHCPDGGGKLPRVRCLPLHRWRASGGWPLHRAPSRTALSITTAPWRELRRITRLPAQSRTRRRGK